MTIKSIKDLKSYIKNYGGKTQFIHEEINGNYLSVVTKDMQVFVACTDSEHVLCISLSDGDTTLW